MGRQSRRKWEQREDFERQIREGMRLRWYEPALFGAIGVVAVTGLRLVFVLPAMIDDPRDLGGALLVVLAAGVAGALGGLTYTVLGVPLRRIPHVGRYLAGIVTVGGYLAFVAAFAFLFLPVVGHQVTRPDDPGVWAVSFGLCTLIFGCVMGHQWFDEPPGR